VMINVARSPEEAVVQAEKGAAVAKATAEKAEVVAAFGAPEETPAEEAGEDKKAKKAKAKPAAEGEAEGSDEPKAKKPRAKKTAEG